jgi:transcriptional regulator with XRE-family HTH domain
MKSFKDFRREALENPGVKAAYDAMEEEFTLARALIEARIHAGLTQEALAAKMQTSQSAVARWERGKRIPSTTTLQRLAQATQTQLRISFVPQPSAAAHA